MSVFFNTRKRNHCSIIVKSCHWDYRASGFKTDFAAKMNVTVHIKSDSVKNLNFVFLAMLAL